MPLTNSTTQYGSLSKLFHWTLFLLITFMLILGFSLDDIPKASKSFAIMIHKSIGLTILLLGILWIFWRLCNTKPRFPLTMPTWEKTAAHTVHWLLYISIVLMPLIGWVMSTAAGHPPAYFNLFKIGLPIAKDDAVKKLFLSLHHAVALVIIGLATIHIAAALKHWLVDKDNIFQRMLPFS